MREARVAEGALVGVQFDRPLEQLAAMAAAYHMGLASAAVSASHADWLADLRCDLILTDKLLSYRVTNRIPSTPIIVLGEAWYKTDAPAERIPRARPSALGPALKTLDKWDPSSPC